MLGIRQHLYRQWESRYFCSPSPKFIKHAVILRNGIKGATWIETGTYKGETTKKLEQFGGDVYTIEPEPILFANAIKKFKFSSRVIVMNGLSEDIFPQLLPTLSGEICFWLDGHYSEGVTFQGPQDTPILDELNCIEEHLSNFTQAVVMVDDVRCFNSNNSNFSNYPKIDFLVDWARRNNLSWQIEQDIFIAKNT